MGIKTKLALMSFLQMGAWGAYLTCMGSFLSNVGLADNIGYFYSIQGIVSIFMPAIIGIIADRWIQAQRVLSLCHLLAGVFMFAVAWYGYEAGDNVQFGTIFTLYTVSVAFYMPTIGLSNSVAFNALTKNGYDTVKAFPPIRVFGTVGFIFMMILVDVLGFQTTSFQFAVSGLISMLMMAYSLTLPACKLAKTGKSKSLADALNLKAFMLFKNPRMGLFFLFSLLLGVCLQITNGYANPFLSSFAAVPEYADSFGVNHANILISLSQMSETLCILLIPFFMKRFGIKNVMLISMIAWVLRFGLFGIGNPGDGVWLFILSMIVYGVAFDFFNISGSLFVDRSTRPEIRSSAQGLFMLMTNGLGATLGTVGAGWVVNHFVYNASRPDWSAAWFVFAAYALVVALLFVLLFREKMPVGDKK